MGGVRVVMRSVGEIASSLSPSTTERIEKVDARQLVTGRLLWSDGVPVRDSKSNARVRGARLAG